MNRIEELFVGLPEYLVMLCEMLAKENRINEAKGIFVRNDLKLENFKEVSGDDRIGEQIYKHRYRAERDCEIPNDVFGPMTFPY